MRQAAAIALRKGLRPLTRQILFRLEKGQVKNPEPEVLRALAGLYDVEYADLAARFFTQRYGLTRDLLSHSIDQPLDPLRGSDVAQVIAAHARIQQQHEALLSATEDVAIRLADALEAQGRKIPVSSDHARAQKGKSGARPRARKTG